MKAFPNHRSEGMELRDYFAAQAMQGLLSQMQKGQEEQVPFLPSIAYKIADLMIDEREKK